MTSNKLLSCGALFLASLGFQAQAASANLNFSGPGVSGNVTVTYGATTDPKVTQGLVTTGISGTFSDSNLNIANATVMGLVPINFASPDPTNLLAPTDFSKYLANGLSNLGGEGSYISYDNLFYPGGSPGVATDYNYGGGVLDIYGLLFKLNNGDVVNLWSNGVTPFAPFSYGVAVASAGNTALDYVTGGVQLAPEPGSLALLGGGLLTLLAWRRKATR